jgi:hypothetical protein
MEIETMAHRREGADSTGRDSHLVAHARRGSRRLKARRTTGDKKRNGVDITGMIYAFE